MLPMHKDIINYMCYVQVKNVTDMSVQAGKYWKNI